MTADAAVTEGLETLLIASSQIEASVKSIRTGLVSTFAQLRDLDTELAAIGFPSKRPDLLAEDHPNDVDRCLDLARDVTTRIRRAVAISLAIKSTGGTA